MRITTIIARWVVRLAGLAQIILGIAFWSGHARGLIPLHMSIGGLFVLALLVIGILAIAAGVRRGFGVFAVVWGVIVLVLGMGQTHMVPGSAHWTIRVLHLLVGLAAMGIGDRLAASILQARGGAGATAASQRVA